MSFPQIRYLSSIATHQAFVQEFAQGNEVFNELRLIDARAHPLGQQAAWGLSDTSKQTQQRILAWFSQHSADLFIVTQPLKLQLAVFDMDSTLIQAEVIDELAREAGFYAQVAAITERAMQGEIDFNQSFQQRMALLKGLPVSLLEQVYQRLSLMPGAQQLMNTLKSLGIECWIISGGFEFFANKLVKQLQMQGFIANALPIDQQQVTGESTTPIINAQAKAWHLTQLMQQRKLQADQCLAVGDGANDILMLKTAGIGIAFHAKPKVRDQAQYHLNQGQLSDIPWLLGLQD